MGEGFHDLQSLDDLLNLTVDRAQGALLFLVEPAAAAAQGLEHLHGDGQNYGRYQKELPVDKEHQPHQAHEHQAAEEHRNHALLQGRQHVVRVVGEAAHQLSVGVLVEVGEGEVLELVK